MAQNEFQSDHSLEDMTRRREEAIRTRLKRDQEGKSKEALDQTSIWCRRALLLTDPHVARRSIIATKGRLSPGTYEWVMKDSHYRKWLDSSKEGDKDRASRLLWISGGPSKGKTMLSVFLTEELERHIAAVENAELVFFFCNQNKNISNTSTLMLYGLISQIVTKRPELSRHVYHNLERLKNVQEHLEAAQRSERSFEETPKMFEFMLDVFWTLIRAPELGTMFCVIDGFDEFITSGSVFSLLLSAIISHFNTRYSSQQPEGKFLLLIISRPLRFLRRHCTEIRLSLKKAVEDTNSLLSEHKTDNTSRFDGSDAEAEYRYLPSQKISFDCKECDAKFTRKSSLRIHMWSRHVKRDSKPEDNSDEAYTPSPVGFTTYTRPLSSTATGISAASGYKTVETETAVHELLRIFTVEEEGSEEEKIQLPNQTSNLVPEVALPMESEEEWIREGYHRALLSRSQMALENLLVAAGFLEPPLEPGMIRMRWKCRCGESFFGDAMEYRYNGIHELTNRMSRSTRTNVTVTSYSKTSTNQNWNFKSPTWLRWLTITSSSVKAMAPNSGGGLPQYNAPNSSTPSTSSAPATSTPTNSNPKLHLLACVHRNERRKCLLQDPIDSVSTDRALFCFMKQQIRRNHSRFRSILALRSIQGMFFVKFRLRMGNNVEVRDHNPCCTSTNPAICECIPPKRKVEPSQDAEYRCSPAGPLATWPPVLSQDLMHMLSSPQCIHEDETWVLDQLPKRTAGKLQACVGKPAEGWGIYYKEGIDFDMIIGVVFAVFLLGSLLFGILWTVLEKDIQSAFGVSAYVVTAISVFVTWVATRAKNLG